MLVSSGRIGASEQDGVRRHDCDHRAAGTIRAEMELATNEAGSESKEVVDSVLSDFQFITGDD